MSGIKGEKREAFEEVIKKVGIGEFNIVAINPTAKEFVDVLGFPEKEDAKEPEYTGTSRDGNRTLRLDFWVKEVNDIMRPTKITFFLEESPRVNKDGTKTQFINDIGICSWAEDEETLPSWFMKREIRTANNGEEDLYSLLRNWLALDYRSEKTELMLDWNQLMRGNVSMLREQVGGDLASIVCLLVTVVSKTKEDEDGNEVRVEYQGIWNKGSLPQYCMKHFRVKNHDDALVKASIQSRDFKDLKLHEKFVANVIGEYGCKDYYELTPLKDYDPTKNPAASEEAMLDPEGYEEDDQGMWDMEDQTSSDY